MENGTAELRKGRSVSTPVQMTHQGFNLAGEGVGAKEGNQGTVTEVLVNHGCSPFSKDGRREHP
jgi:hypothetical protein